MCIRDRCTSNKAASVASCDRCGCDMELKLVMQPITTCVGRCGHAVASVGAVWAPSRDSYQIVIAVRGMSCDILALR